MPKVSDYELEHINEENEFQPMKRNKRKKPVKEKKYSEKVDHRSEWKKSKKVEDNSVKEDDLEYEE